MKTLLGWDRVVSCGQKDRHDNARGTDKSLALAGRKQARKHVRDARDFNNIETRAVIIFFFLLSKAPKEIHAILTESLACFLPGRAKKLSAPLYICFTQPFLDVLKVVFSDDRPVRAETCSSLLYPAWTRRGTYVGCCSQEGRSSELMLRRGVRQVAHNLINPQVECTGVLLCVIRE